MSFEEKSTTDSTNESTTESTSKKIEAPNTELTIAAPRVCSPIQVLYQKIQVELENIFTEISKFQQEAMSRISENEQQHQLLQKVPESAPIPPAAAAPARMNLIQLWNMVQLLQQNQKLAASQQLLQQAATISPPVTQEAASR